MKFINYTKSGENNIQMSSKIFLILIIFASMLNSCEEKTYYPLDEDFVRYFGIYKDGSWWRYEEVMTNSIDSIYVDQYRDTWQMYGDREKDLYQYIRYQLVGKDKTSMVTIMQQHNNTSLLRIAQYKHTITSFGSFCIVKENYQLSGEAYLPPTGVQKIDSINIGEYKFFDIIKMWNITGDTLWFVKNTGLVKVSDENDTYNIVNYQTN